MSEVILNFIYNGQEIKIQTKRDVYMKEIFNKCAIKVNKEKQNLYFLYDGKEISDDIKLKNLNNKDIYINILVYDIMRNTDIRSKNIVIKESKDIICPKGVKIA